MNGLKVTVPTRGKTPVMTIVDGCAVLWKIQWPSANGTVQEFVKSFHKFVYDMLKKNDLVIIFDRYYDYSENGNVIQSSKRVKITLTGPAHDKNVVLASKDNTLQLIRILVESLKTLQLQGRESERKLIITGLDPIPFEVCRGNVRDRLDIKNFQEEADTIIVAQMLSMVNEGYRQIQVTVKIQMCLLFFSAIIMSPTTTLKESASC